jgi:ATP-dependent helicase HrpB
VLWEFARSNNFRIDVLRDYGIHAVTARQVDPLLEQFLRIAKSERLDIRETSNSDALKKCILMGFSDRVARRLDDVTLRCKLAHGRRGNLAKESVVRNSSLLVAAEIQEIGRRQGEVDTILSLASAVSIEWLHELFPNDIQSATEVEFDSASRRVMAQRVVKFRDLPLSEERIEPPPAGPAAALLAEEIMAGRLQLASWNHGVAQWIVRLNLLSKWCPELRLPPIEDSDRRQILEQFCLGSLSFKDLKDRDVAPEVLSWLSYEQRHLLDKHAPERVHLSNGKTPKVTYDTNNPPFISLRIQELFGVTDSPRIAMGRIPLNIHILAPSMRPVQVTQDLANFWREHYPGIKSELKRNIRNTSGGSRHQSRNSKKECELWFR